MRGFRWLLLSILIAILAVVHAGEAQDRNTEPSFSEELSVDYVLVPVVVTGYRGTVEDLPREAFELLVDGHSVPIESFETGDTPVTLFFLQDLSGSMALLDKLDSSRRLLEFFVDSSAPGDRFSLITFAGNNTETVVPLTADIERMRSAALTWRGYGTTALHDAVALLPELIVDKPSDRRAVVLVSDGLDNASGLDANAARERIQATDIPVYVLGLRTGSPYELDSQGEKLHRYADMMNLLAHLTGGRYYAASSAGDIDTASAAILDELRHQYILGFSTGGTGNPAEHQIEVRVRRRRAEIGHRRGYFGQPPLTPRS